MTHSGLNAYLTLHIAQVLLRAGDLRFLDIVDTVVGLASPTGQSRGGRGADPVFGDPDALAGYGRVACIRPRADGLRRGIAAADARAAAPGAREVVSDGINGRLLEVEESAAFADALDWAAGRSPQQMDALRQAARTTAEAFSMQSTAEKALAAYVAVTSRTQCRGRAQTSNEQTLDRVINLIRAEWDIVKGMAEAGSAALRKTDALRGSE